MKAGQLASTTALAAASTRTARHLPRETTMHHGPNRGFTRGTCLALAVLLALLSGCSRTQIGIRPNEPARTLYSPCADLKNQVDYAKDLSEAYRSRASLNRFAIYAAGILGLGTAAATGGLGAAGAAALTLTLLSVSGGFATGSVAVIQNDQLADCYTSAANDLDTGVSKSLSGFDPQRTSADRVLAPEAATREDRGGEPDSPETDPKKLIANMDTESCRKSLRLLACRTTKARNDLETARTDSIAGLMKRMEVQQKKIAELVKKTEEAAKQTSNTTATTLENQPTTTTTIPKDECELEEEQREKQLPKF
jgi:hypothetical protein